MAQRKYKDRNIRNLTKTGGHSIGLTIPIDIIRDLGWKERQKVVVKRQGSKLVVEDWKDK
jgi:antitoxin component of MazEF toxin-antitoxin module